jgi:site-specific DNA recombinase
VSLIATRGPSLDMSTAYGRGMAGLLGEFDTMESEVKAERQQLAAFHRAQNGRPPAGVRLTGYTMTGVVVEHEAAVVRQMFTRFHAGDSLRGIVAWLTEQAVPTRSGRPWNPSSVRTILANPRYAGRVVYRGQYPGEVTGKMGAWPPLVDEWLFDAVQATLSDPRRRKQIGTHRKHLGSGLYLCGCVITLSGPTPQPRMVGSGCATGAPRAGTSPAARHRSTIWCSAQYAPAWPNPT